MSKVLALLALGLGRAAGDKWAGCTGTHCAPQPEGIGGCARECEDSTSWLRNGRDDRSCSWVSGNPEVRCRLRASGDGALGVGTGPLAADACAVTCGTCPAACVDSFAWYVDLPDGEPATSTSEGCADLDGTGSVLKSQCETQEDDTEFSPRASEACTSTCKTCPGSPTVEDGNEDRRVKYAGCVYPGNAARDPEWERKDPGTGNLPASVTTNDVSVQWEACCDSTSWIKDFDNDRGCFWVSKDAEDRCMHRDVRDGIMARDACPAACGRCPLCSSIPNDVLNANGYDNCCDDPTWTHGDSPEKVLEGGDTSGSIIETCTYIATDRDAPGSLSERCNTWEGYLLNPDGTVNPQPVFANRACRATCRTCFRQRCCPGSFPGADRDDPWICDRQEWRRINANNPIPGRYQQGCDWVAELPCARCRMNGWQGNRVVPASFGCPVACGFCPNEPTAFPTVSPTAAPTDPTAKPTADPTAKPTADPTAKPTADPTAKPTADPTAKPTADPTAKPTADPTYMPTADPTYMPTADPTAEPTVTPTGAPNSQAPTEEDAGGRKLGDALMDAIEDADADASALQFFFVDFGAPGTGAAPAEHRRRLFDAAKGCRDAPFAAGQCAMKLHDVPAVCGAWKDCAGVVCGPADFVLDGETACVARGAVDFGASDSKLYALVKEAPKGE